VTALTFPLGYDAFWGALRIQSAAFYLPESLEMNRTASGEVLTADMGARLWEAEVQLAQGIHDDQTAIEAFMSILRQAGRTFQAGDPRRKYPAYDPTGSILGAASPTISAFAANSREITISGLPANYQIRRGDFLSFAYGSSPVRQALHQVVTAKTASAGGVATDIEVTPHIRSGATAGIAVQLAKPWCKAQVVPGSYRPGFGARVHTSGASFRIVQTLR